MIRGVEVRIYSVVVRERTTLNESINQIKSINAPPPPGRLTSSTRSLLALHDRHRHASSFSRSSLFSRSRILSTNRFPLSPRPTLTSASR